MSDGRPKPAIPAWQRNAQTKPSPPPTEDPVSAQPESARNDDPVEGGKAIEVEAEDTTSPNEEPESVPASDTSPTTAPVAEAVEEQKPSSFAASDFDTFRQQRQAPQQTQSPAVQQQAPPIITYPEFLVEAHKPPPLITPSRILNTVYAAGTAAALLYGASKLVVNPMVDALSSARHEYFNHTHSKVDEFNERLSKIVSKVPEVKKAGPTEVDVNDVESVTSDPTELYHRDMGTQTEVLPMPTTVKTESEKKEAITYQFGALKIMKEHINEIAAGAERNATANKDRQEKMNQLRHYLDGLIYGSHSLNAWQTNEDAIAMKKGDGKEEDPIEGLKKEIRAVKGVLLSAKRFPSVNRPVAGAA